MWKLPCVVFFLITIDNTSTQDQPGTTEISRNFRNYENQFQRYRSEVRSIEYEGTGFDRDVEDYARTDSSEFENEDLIGRWRNSGSALEPKWRDGDSPPLVPFENSSRGKKIDSQDAKNEETRVFVSSRHTEKILHPEDPKLSRLRIEDRVTMSEIPIASEDRGFSFDEINERYERLENSDDFRYDESPTVGISKVEKIPIILEPREQTVATRPGVSAGRTERTRSNDEPTYAIEPYASRTRHVDAFQAHPSEYEPMDEEYRKPRARKRRPPESHDLVETRPPTYSISWSTETYVETSPSSFAKKPEVTSRSGINEASGHRTSENAELRSLLKNRRIEGLSLSELLHRRNFTLYDLLRGKAEALRILESGVEDESGEVIGVRSKVFEASNDRSLSIESDGTPPTTIERNEGKSEEKVVSSDGISQTGSSSENERLSAIVRLAKSIIIPRQNVLTDKTSPGETPEDYLETRDFRMSSESSSKLDDEIMEFSDFTGKVARPKESTSKRYESQFNENSVSTLSIENILTSTQRTTTMSLNNRTKNHYVGTATRQFAESVIRSPDLDYQSDEPRRVDENEATRHSSDEKATKIDQVPKARDGASAYRETSSEPYELVSKLEPEARAEIFELFSTGTSAKRLVRLLKSRNMSIDELIELRQRGSSSLHLAEISRDRDITKVVSRSPEVTNTSLVDGERAKLNFATVNENDESSSSLDLRSFDSLPFFSRPVLDDTRKSTISVKTETKSTLVQTDEYGVETTPKSPEYPRHRVVVGLVEEITGESIKSVDEDQTETRTRRNQSIVARNKDEKSNSSKVRPSIIASGAILGFAVVVFCSIFVVCRIRQKQRYTYRKNFPRTVFQAPTTVRKLSNSSSLNTIMVNVVATSTNVRNERREIDENFETRSDIENDSLNDANDSWETIPDFMK